MNALHAHWLEIASRCRITCTQQLVAAEVIDTAEAAAAVASHRVLVEAAVAPIAYWAVVWYPV